MGTPLSEDSTAAKAEADMAAETTSTTIICMRITWKQQAPLDLELPDTSTVSDLKDCLCAAFGVLPRRQRATSATGAVATV